MKIVSCFSDLAEIGPLVKAGADELYCATAAFPAYGSAALLPGRDLPAAIKAAHSRGVKISLAVNSMFIPSAEVPRLLAGLLRLDRAGLDALIISSPALFGLLMARSGLGAKLHLSSIQPCFNTQTAKLFIGYGVSRIIFPNQLSGAEAAPIIELCRASGVETELFDYRFFGCTYVNGRCKLHRPAFHTFRKVKEGAALCRSGAGAWPGLGLKSFDTDPARSGELREVSARVGARMGCGGPLRIADAGAFYDYFTAGADYLKYGTRSDPAAAKVKKVAAMRAMIALAGESLGKFGPAQARASFIEKLNRWDPHGF
ncbi:MAG: U32 family peptidase [Elusimicrobiales bacterium]|nr:U32 family peptidase [Elusimicrobiales bacterium]